MTTRTRSRSTSRRAQRAISGLGERTVEGVREALRHQAWWHTTLLVIGIVTLVTAVAVMFLGMNSAPRTVTTNEPVPPVDSLDFAVAYSRQLAAPIEQGGAVEILNNGDEFLPALLQSISDAKSSINFSVYIWDDGAFSDQVLDALIKRQSDGVAVRVLLDGIGARKSPGDRFEALRNVGGRVETFRTAGFGTWTRFHRRNHRRAIVIDGRVGFTGGMAVSDFWLGHAQDADHWRDMMFKVTGPLASSLQSAFADAWVGASGEILVGEAIYPTSVESERGVQRFIHHVNSPADDDQSMAYLYLMPVLAARKSVYITMPYFIPDDPLKDALKEKARAGVDVRLLLPGPEMDNRSARLSGQNHYDTLMEAGVRIYEYQPTFLHSKVAVVDGQWTVIGSPNINSRSRQLDEENAFGILDAGLGAQLDAVFMKDLQSAEEIDLQEWRRRNPFVRIAQLFSRVLDQQS